MKANSKIFQMEEELKQYIHFQNFMILPMTLKVNVKIIQLGTTFFYSWSNHMKLSDCDDYITVLE